MPGKWTEHSGCGRKVERTMAKQRGMEVFIVRESGESANAARHTQSGRRLPGAGKGGPLAVPSFIIKYQKINRALNYIQGLLLQSLKAIARYTKFLIYL